jgi:hypothetical protein
MTTEDEKYVLCYKAFKKALLNTHMDLISIIEDKNPHNIPDPKLQLTFLRGWMQVVQSIEDAYGVNEQSRIIN